MLSKDVHDHLWSGEGGQAHVNERQVAEQEVHGGVKVWAEQNCEQNQAVAQHGHQVEKGKHHKKKIWSSGESVSPSNTNSDTLEWLAPSIDLQALLYNDKMEQNDRARKYDTSAIIYEAVMISVNNSPEH